MMIIDELMSHCYGNHFLKSPNSGLYNTLPQDMANQCVLGTHFISSPFNERYTYQVMTFRNKYNCA